MTTDGCGDGVGFPGTATVAAERGLGRDPRGEKSKSI